MAAFARSEDLGKLVLRFAVGGLLLFHGIAKLDSGIAWMAGPLGRLGLPAFVGYGVYVGEIVAPLLLLVGLRSRLAGLVVAFNMLMAIVLVSHPKLFTLAERGGAWGIEIEAFFLLGGLSLFWLGGGRYALSTKSRWD
jgi:putative oxidoreductase